MAQFQKMQGQQFHRRQVPDQREIPDVLAEEAIQALFLPAPQAALG